MWQYKLYGYRYARTYLFNTTNIPTLKINNITIKYKKISSYELCVK